MNSADQIVVGLDIGTTKVAVVAGALNEHGKVNILGIGRAPCEGVRRGEVINIDKTADAIIQAVREAETHANVEINSVYVGIAGEHIRSSREESIITLSNADQQITQSDVQRLRHEMYRLNTPIGTKIIHALPQEYTVDAHRDIKDPVGMSGVRLQSYYHVVTAHSPSIKNIHTCVAKAGLDVVDVVLQPLASSFATLSDEEMEAGVCLVDIGGGTTDVAVFYDGVVRHTAVVPLGGRSITEDVRKGCSLMKHHAERIKTQYGCAYLDERVSDDILTISMIKERDRTDRTKREISRHTLTKIIQARVEEIAEFALRELGASGFLDLMAAGLVITGGGSKLEGITDLFSYVTGLDARIGEPIEHLAMGMVQEVNKPEYATATGLVMYGLKHADKMRYVAPQDQNAKRGELNPRNPAPKGRGIIDRVKDYFETLSSSNIVD